jgi:hypothetical protein
VPQVGGYVYFTAGNARRMMAPALAGFTAPLNQAQVDTPSFDDGQVVFR